MKIVWLEDDPTTIRNVEFDIKEELKTKTVICESFSEFSQELYELEDSEENIVIIDIRMLFNKENEFSCFEKDFKISEELDAGFEYYKECLKNRFSKTKITFFTSKPFDEAKHDARKYNIDINMLITKDDVKKLFAFIKDKK